MSTASATTTLMSALRESHQRLDGLLTTIPTEDVTQPAYPTEWSIAQVASHLGSQAETFLLSLDAGRHGTAPPGLEQFQPIWDRWNAKQPAEQVSDSLSADREFLDAVAALTDAERGTWRLTMMGAEQELSGLLRMRLVEHLLHTWDIDVALDDSATLPAPGAALVIDQLPLIVRYTAKASIPTQIRITTTEPELTLRLSLAPDGSQLVRDRADMPAGQQGSADHDQTVRLPTEAFVRLVYGRLDSDHTPPTVDAAPGLLDALRTALPGV